MARKQGTITRSFTFNNKRYYVTGKTEKEVMMKLANKLRDLEEGVIVISGTMTVREWAYRAVEAYKTNQAEITRKKYLQRMKHCVLEHIGSLQLKQVKPLHCQQVLNMQEGLSRTQVNEVYQTLKFIFKTAVDNELIAKSPAENLTKPSYKSGSRRAITAQERKHLISVCDGDRRFTLFLLMLYCGCRPSEAREAMGKDIRKIEGQPVLHIRGTKTANADRFVPLPDILYRRIKNTPSLDYISPNEAGKKHDSSSYKRLCNRLYREMNISMGCRVYRNRLIPPYPLAGDFVPYNLRHTYCTDLQKQGIDIRTAQYLMGHADIQMTANIYTHADNSIIIEAAKLINGTTVGTTPDTAFNRFSAK